jgi:enoyl-[acyl-carrier protein] reductase I
MSLEPNNVILAGHKALIVGIANEQSIAYGCAKAFREQGAELALTYLNDKAKTYVEPLARDLGAELLLPLDVWAQLHTVVHSIAFAPKEDLQGCLVDCSAEGFATAMDISCHSFIRMARLAEPLMKEGGTLFAMTFHGAQQVVAGYNLMGPVKAALEAACR